MSHKIRNLITAVFLTSFALFGSALAQQPVTTAMTEQPGLISHLQSLGLDIDHTSIVIMAIGSAIIMTAAMGLNGLFILFMLFGRPILNQMVAQMNSGPPGSTPMDGMTAAAGNTMRNLFGGQDMVAIITKIMNAILPALLRSTSQFVTDQANPQMG